MNVEPGIQRVTVDSAIGVAGQPVRVHCVTLVSTATASTLILRNGISASSTANEQVDGVISQAVTKNYAGGLLFPNGCFADADANISYATFIFTTEA